MNKGIYTALITPFDEHGKVKENGLREIVRQNIDQQKVDGLFVNGSTGENFMMSTEQKKKVFEIVHEENQGEVTLIAQIGSLNLDEAIELGKYVTNLGYSCLSAITPFYYKFTFEDIKSYYKSIVDSTGNSMMIYTIPSLTGFGLSMDQYEELFEIDGVIGVKYSDSNMFTLERLKKAYPDKLFFFGVDEMLIHGAISGIDAAIGSTYNVNGRRAKQILELCEEGNISEAYKIQNDTNDLIEVALDLGLFQVLKEYLNIKGFDAGVTKSPMQNLNKSAKDKVRQLVERFG